MSPALNLMKVQWYSTLNAVVQLKYTMEWSSISTQDWDIFWACYFSSLLFGWPYVCWVLMFSVCLMQIDRDEVSIRRVIGAKKDSYYLDKKHVT